MKTNLIRCLVAQGTQLSSLRRVLAESRMRDSALRVAQGRQLRGLSRPVGFRAVRDCHAEAGGRPGSARIRPFQRGRLPASAHFGRGICHDMLGCARICPRVLACAHLRIFLPRTDCHHAATMSKGGWFADCQSAKQQTVSLRYSEASCVVFAGWSIFFAFSPIFHAFFRRKWRGFRGLRKNRVFFIFFEVGEFLTTDDTDGRGMKCRTDDNALNHCMGKVGSEGKLRSQRRSRKRDAPPWVEGGWVWDGIPPCGTSFPRIGRLGLRL
jgi:hypothetical protein